MGLAEGDPNHNDVRLAEGDLNHNDVGLTEGVTPIIMTESLTCSEVVAAESEVTSPFLCEGLGSPGLSHFLFFSLRSV